MVANIDHPPLFKISGSTPVYMFIYIYISQDKKVTNIYLLKTSNGPVIYTIHSHQVTMSSYAYTRNIHVHTYTNVQTYIQLIESLLYVFNL